SSRRGNSRRRPFPPARRRSCGTPRGNRRAASRPRRRRSATERPARRTPLAQERVRRRRVRASKFSKSYLGGVTSSSHMPGDFVHPHPHSQSPLLDGANRLPELCKRVGELGMGAVAVTDHGNMFGAFHFFHEALQNGIRPIVGVEAYIAPADRTDREATAASESGEGYAYHLTLLAATQKGYRNLVRLVSEAYLTGFYHRPRMDKALLREHAEGLIGLSGCLKGEVAGSLSRGSYPAALKAFREYEEIFGKGNFYVEIMDHGLPQQTAIVPELL